MHFALFVRNTRDPVFEILLNRQVREQVCFLEHIADGPLVGREKQAVFILPGVRADLQPARHALKSRDAAQEGGLAAARRSEQGGDAAHRAVERNVQRKGAQRAGKTDVNTDFAVAHVPTLAIRFSSRNMVRITINENTSIPPANK